MPPDVEPEFVDSASECDSDDLEMDEDVTVVDSSEDAIGQRRMGCVDEIDMVLDWATEKDKKRVRRYLESDNSAEGRWSLTKFRTDSCAWPDTARQVMYGPHAARVCMAGELMSGDFHMAVGSPPEFVVEIQLLRAVDADAINRLKVHWNGKVVTDRRIRATRRLDSFKEAFDCIFWAGERLAPPGFEQLMAFTSFRPEDLVYLECSISRDDGDVVFRLEAIHFIARPLRNL